MKGIFSLFSGKGKTPKYKPVVGDHILNSLAMCVNFVSQHLRNERLYQSNHISKETTELVIEIRGGTFRIDMLDTVSELSFIADAIVSVLAEFAPIFTYELSELLLKPNADVALILTKLPRGSVAFLGIFFKHIERVLNCKAASIVDVVNAFGTIMIEPYETPDELIKERNDMFDTIIRDHNCLQGGGVFAGMDRSQISAAATVQDRSVKITFPRSGLVLNEADLKKKMSTFGNIVNVGMKKKVAVILYEDIHSVTECMDEWDIVLPEGYMVTAMGNVPPRHLTPTSVHAPSPQRVPFAGSKHRDTGGRFESPPPFPHEDEAVIGSMHSTPRHALEERATHQLLRSTDQSVCTPPPSDDDNSVDDDRGAATVRVYENRSPKGGEDLSMHAKEVSSILKDHSALNTSVMVQDFSSIDETSERLSFGDHSPDEDNSSRQTPDVDYTQSALQREAARLRKAREAEIAAAAALSPATSHPSGDGANASLDSNVDDVLLSPPKGDLNQPEDCLAESTGSLWRVASKRVDHGSLATTASPDIQKQTGQTSLGVDTLSTDGFGDDDDDDPVPLSSSSRQDAFIMKSPPGHDKSSQLLSPTKRAPVRLTSSSKVIRVRSGEWPTVADSRDVPGAHSGDEEYQRETTSPQAHRHSRTQNDAQSSSSNSLVVHANDETLAQPSDDSSRMDDLSEHNGDTPLRDDRIRSVDKSGLNQRISFSTTAQDKTPNKRGSPAGLHSTAGDVSEVDDVSEATLLKIGEEQKYRLMATAYPELTVQQPHPAVGGIYHQIPHSSYAHPHEYIHQQHLSAPTSSVAAANQPAPSPYMKSGQGMEHMLHRIRLLEADSKARREQQAEDEGRLRQCEGEWAAEITALRVQLSDMEGRLDEERRKNRKALQEIATRESEVQSLKATKEAMEQRLQNAKAAAEREALSTVLAQQRLIKMLETQRDADAEKCQLLEKEVADLRHAFQTVVSDMLDKSPMLTLTSSKVQRVESERLQDEDGENSHSNSLGRSQSDSFHRPAITDIFITADKGSEARSLLPTSGAAANSPLRNRSKPKDCNVKEGENTEGPDLVSVAEDSGDPITDGLRRSAQQQIERYLQRQVDKKRFMDSQKVATPPTSLRSSARQNDYDGTRLRSKKAGREDAGTDQSPVRSQESEVDPLNETDHFEESLRFQQQLSTRLAENLRNAKKETDSFYTSMKSRDESSHHRAAPSKERIVEPPKLRFGSGLAYISPSQGFISGGSTHLNRLGCSHAHSSVPSPSKYHEDSCFPYATRTSSVPSSNNSDRRYRGSHGLAERFSTSRSSIAGFGSAGTSRQPDRERSAAPFSSKHYVNAR